MENKSMKYYLLGAAVLIVVIIAAVILAQKPKPAAQPQTEMVNTPAASEAAPTPAASVPVTPAPAESAPAASATAPAAPATNSTTASPLIGTWNSSETGKGLQGSGQITIRGVATKLSLTSDANLVITKVENNVGTGTITFKDTCVNATKSVAGQPDVVEPKQCLDPYSQKAAMQITGNAITYTGETILGASVSLKGTIDGDTMSGTFVRTSSSGKIDGTFSLTRSKN
jgi:hypothetical protein